MDRGEAAQQSWSRGQILGWLCGLTLLGVVTLGYHPCAEDGALYVAEIKHSMRPELYPRDAGFLSGHLGFNVFTHLVAGLAGHTGVPLDWVLLGLHTVCIAGILLGIWLIAAEAYPDRWSRVGAAALGAVLLGLPVAGTSLYVEDPYLTARSLVTALTLLGIAAVVRGGRRGFGIGAGVAFLLALSLHPLMAAYGLVVAAITLLQLAPTPRRNGGTFAILGAAVVAAGLTQALAPAEPAEYLNAAMSRYYWFVAQWQWFEWIGLAAPLGILAWFGWWQGCGSRVEGALARAGVFAGGTAVLIAMLFARASAATHLMARMQPLRVFLFVYLIMLIPLGAAMGRMLGGSVVRWTAALAVLAVGMGFVAHATYPGSSFFEVPGGHERNAWVRAFVWARDHTPRDAVFALDADYIGQQDEDAQGFRAIAERGALPDAAKDGGIASIRPKLVPAWVAGVKAQTGLSTESDAERQNALAGTGVSWLVLRREAKTSLECPYTNERVMVCRLP